MIDLFILFSLDSEWSSSILFYSLVLIIDTGKVVFRPSP